MAKILVVEDAAAIATLLSDHLTQRGHDVAIIHDGEQAIEAMAEEVPDLLILDLMLPGRSGLEVCRAVRQSAARQPLVLMLTARVSEEDVVLGFEVGADDYVRKPFRIAELMARIQALLRLAERPRSGAAGGPARLALGDLEIDPAARSATVGGRELPLTPKEFDLLLCLARQPGVVRARRELLEEVWGYRHDGYARTVDTHVNRLRKKLGAAGLAADLIATVHGSGYRLDG